MNTAIKRIGAFNYFGGKARYLDWLFPLFPPVSSYQHYVEVFSGSAACFLNKEPSPIETINDIDGTLINFFHVMREKPEELISKLELTPYSRPEFIIAVNDEGDDVERARRFFIRVMQSYGGMGSSSTRITSWRTQFGESRYGISMAVSKWWNKVYGLKDVINRLRMAQIENRDFRYILTNYDTPRTFFYCDSPYDHATRTGKKDYRYEFLTKDHRDMAKLLNKIEGKAAVSGYDSELMQELYPAKKGWIKNLGPDRQTNLGTKSRKREVLWTNYDPHFGTGKLF